MQVGDATGAKAHWCCATIWAQSTSVNHRNCRGKTNTLIRNTSTTSNNHQYAELCGDLFRTEGSSSLKSTRTGSTGETRGKPIKRRASKLQKRCIHILESPHHLSQPTRELRNTKQIDLALSFSHSLVFSKRHILNHTPQVSPFSPEMVDLLWPSSSSANRALGGKKIEYRSNTVRLKNVSFFLFLKHCSSSSSKGVHSATISTTTGAATTT
jgi:hypothetical protein